MGNCASQPTTMTAGRNMMMSMATGEAATAKVIHVDGRLQEFKQPIRAGHLIPKNPNCFLCCSESMHPDSPVPQVGEEEELQLGQIYFVMPLTFSQLPLSLPDLCSLAVKASSALSSSSAAAASPFPLRTSSSGCRIPLPSHGLGFDRRNQGVK